MNTGKRTMLWITTVIAFVMGLIIIWADAWAYSFIYFITGICNLAVAILAGRGWNIANSKLVNGLIAITIIFFLLFIILFIVVFYGFYMYGI
jgi:hypothetical protein